MHSIVELTSFARDAAKLLSEGELAELLTYVAFHPEAGDLIRGSGGFRKLRWAQASKGKRGGVRTIYFYYNRSMPILMVSIYGKNEQSNISKAEVNALAEMAKKLKSGRK